MCLPYFLYGLYSLSGGPRCCWDSCAKKDLPCRRRLRRLRRHRHHRPSVHGMQHDTYHGTYATRSLVRGAPRSTPSFIPWFPTTPAWRFRPSVKPRFYMAPPLFLVERGVAGPGVQKKSCRAAAVYAAFRHHRHHRPSVHGM